MSDRLLTSVTVVDEESAGIQLFGECDRLEFAAPESRRSHDRLTRIGDMQPGRRACGPVAYNLRCMRMRQLRDHSARSEHASVECWQHLLIADEDQIQKRRCEIGRASCRERV